MNDKPRGGMPDWAAIDAIAAGRAAAKHELRVKRRAYEAMVAEQERARQSRREERAKEQARRQAADYDRKREIEKAAADGGVQIIDMRRQFAGWPRITHGTDAARRGLYGDQRYQDVRGLTRDYAPAPMRPPSKSGGGGAAAQCLDA
jgi:hypothetical protein